MKKEWPASGLVFPSSHGTQLSGFSKIKEDWDHRIMREIQAVGGEDMLVP
jgi:hypothetical protein